MSAEVIVNLIGLAADVIGGISKRIDDDELKTVISDQYQEVFLPLMFLQAYAGITTNSFQRTAR